MADSRDQKWHTILKLALSVGSDVAGEHRPTSKPSFASGDGAVGLAIVAALSEEPPAYRSEPILIGAVVTKPSLRAAASFKDEGTERSESYTCVISHLGGNKVKKRVYFGDGDGDGGLLLEPPSPPEDPPFVVAEFLRCCFVCKKQLDGMDVYMYRGKAFCCEECRYQQMLLEEFGDKLSTGTSRNYKYSSSPCSASLLVTAGIEAASVH
ncbi:FCS-Like Zinc finger 13-like [Curcuma longa]|uniref:FCS-Like Zinc finger 13-like n=1 Tax=Curcuma longa TaxID=136217 RepID=UPI003D9F832E